MNFLTLVLMHAAFILFVLWCFTSKRGAREVLNYEEYE